jgi:hypothetical protein
LLQFGLNSWILKKKRKIVINVAIHFGQNIDMWLWCENDAACRNALDRSTLIFVEVIQTNLTFLHSSIFRYVISLCSCPLHCNFMCIPFFLRSMFSNLWTINNKGYYVDQFGTFTSYWLMCIWYPTPIWHWCYRQSLRIIVLSGVIMCVLVLHR